MVPIPKTCSIAPVVMVAALLLTSCGIKRSINDRPDIGGLTDKVPERVELDDTTFTSGNDHLLKNRYGQWELLVDGDPLELGLSTGILSQELFHKQEIDLFSKVEEMVPGKGKQKLLRRFLAYFNRKMYKHITNEYKAEIYGLSQYASHRYDYIADPYMRILYLHGAHDIGHAVQDLALVGCTSFAVWDEHSSDGELLLGRNFDFYAGDSFAEEKIIAFIEPDSGHSFMSVTWGGMLGVVSGMNEEGLTVTINAGHSKIPLSAKTPISLLTREILQYASTIDEAIAIAEKREVFVSESIMVGSANDRRAALIEVSPKKVGVYEVPNSDQLICSNHFQSETYSKDKRNIEHIESSHSLYRYERMQQLLDEHRKLGPQGAVNILRNRRGLDDKAIGYGNEKALNQLLAHHSIVFKPEERLVWVSSNPYQLGEFVAYDLDEIFGEHMDNDTVQSFARTDLTIAEDPFLHTQSYKDYEAYRRFRHEVLDAIENEERVPDERMLDVMIIADPEYWEAYYLVGMYHQTFKEWSEATKAYEQAMTKEITTSVDKEDLEKRLKRTRRKAR